jgi:uncharacterized protein (DUF305 family)
MNSTNLRGLVTLALLLALAACQTEVADDHDHAAGTTAMEHESMAGMDGMSGVAHAYSDARFLDHMAEHHRMAVEMAEMAQTRAQSADLRTMAAGMGRTQQAEIEQLQRWRQAWFSGTPVDSTVDMAMMGMMTPMDSLASASDFDRAFLEMMIPHHAGAVMMAGHAQAETEREEVRAFARRVVEDQAREIGEMQRMLTAMPAAPGGAPVGPSSGAPADTANAGPSPR